jgi:hypothetical protein
LEATYPRNSGQGAEILGFHLRRKFWPGAENSGPPEIFILKILARNPGPLLKVAPQLERKDLAKIRRAGNSEIFGPPEIMVTQNFWPLPASCTTAFCKGLSQIFEGQKLWNFWPLKIRPNQNFRPLYRALHHNVL